MGETLPDRGDVTAATKRNEVFEAWLRGDLKSRDEMNLEAAAKTSGLPVGFGKTTAERVVDAAWGKVADEQ